jgi:hypothetical protein
VLRPDAEVAVVGLDEIEEYLARFAPNVVVSDRPNAMSSDGVTAWVEVPVSPAGPAKASLGEDEWEFSGSALELLLEVVEKAEQTAPDRDHS